MVLNNGLGLGFWQCVPEWEKDAVADHEDTHMGKKKATTTRAISFFIFFFSWISAFGSCFHSLNRSEVFFFFFSFLLLVLKLWTEKRGSRFTSWEVSLRPICWPNWRSWKQSSLFSESPRSLVVLPTSFLRCTTFSLFYIYMCLSNWLNCLVAERIWKGKEIGKWESIKWDL